ncbi:5454_t:CDS:2, partial [Acaulospora colombiana]
IGEAIGKSIGKKEVPSISVGFPASSGHIISESSGDPNRPHNAEMDGKIARTLEKHSDLDWSIAFSPDETHIIVLSSSEPERVWEDGKLVASAYYSSKIRIWDSKTGQLVKELETHMALSQSLAFSADGRHFVSGHGDGAILIWDLETRKSMEVSIVYPEFYVCSVVFSSDGKLVASGTHHDTIWVWDTETLKAIGGPYEGHAPVLSLAFSPDSKRIVSGHDWGPIRVWDVETGNSVLGPLGDDKIWRVLSVSFSSDGDVISSQFIGHTREILSVKFSSDGKCVFSASADKTIRVWSLDTQWRRTTMWGLVDYGTAGRESGRRWAESSLKASFHQLWPNNAIGPCKPHSIAIPFARLGCRMPRNALPSPSPTPRSSDVTKHLMDFFGFIFSSAVSQDDHVPKNEEGGPNPSDPFQSM